MGLLTFSINVTLDGCVDHREGIADDETHAKIGVISLPPWGEQLDAIDPYQAELNRRFSDYNAELRQLARDARVAYIPFYERFCDLLRASPGKPFTSFRILPFYRDIFRQFVLRMSNDEIVRRNGWKYHRDGIHLNSVSGKLLADLVQEFLDGELRRESG
jgi:lysophospholipase L1-like esterase